MIQLIKKGCSIRLTFTIRLPTHLVQMYLIASSKIYKFYVYHYKTNYKFLRVAFIIFNKNVQRLYNTTVKTTELSLDSNYKLMKVMMLVINVAQRFEVIALNEK